MKFKRIIICAFILISYLSVSQSLNNSKPNKIDFATKNQHWLDLNLGLSFFSSNLSVLDEFTPLLTEKPDYFGFLIQPKYQYFIEDKWSIGAHLGFGHENLYENSIDFDQTNQVYFAGVQTEFYVLNVKNIMYLSTEVDASLQYVVTHSSDSNVYFKSGLSLITSFLIKDQFLVFVKLSDVLSYTTDEDNFFNLDQGFSLNNSFDNFINFPQFGIRYKLF